MNEERAKRFIVLRERQHKGGLNSTLQLEVTEVSEGYAVLEMPVVTKALNPIGTVHGGALFTLADAAAGTAAASYGEIAVTAASSINYLRAGKPGQTLRATAREVKHGRTVGVYTVDVENDRGDLLTTSTFTMIYTGKMVPE